MDRGARSLKGGTQIVGGELFPEPISIHAFLTVELKLLGSVRNPQGVYCEKCGNSLDLTVESKPRPLPLVMELKQEIQRVFKWPNTNRINGGRYWIRTSDFLLVREAL